MWYSSYLPFRISILLFNLCTYDNWPCSAERKGLEPLRQKYDYSEISNLLPYQLGLPLQNKFNYYILSIHIHSAEKY